MENYNEIPWKILYKYFQNNPSFLVKHHLESYNNFFDTGIIQLFKETNPIHFFKASTIFKRVRNTNGYKVQTAAIQNTIRAW